jgi:pyruvate formate lyase activating enzyme
MEIMRPALFVEGEKCFLCPRECKIGEGKSGFCRVRKNIEGKIFTIVYGEAERSIHFAIDPIEKKPLYHFLPGSMTYSFGTPGCNFACKHCQNWSLSQALPQDVESEYLTPEVIVSNAKRATCRSISYTYSEPIIFYEYMLDTARMAHAAGVKNVMVTNGFINREPLETLLPLIDAANIDVKAFTNKFYGRVCAAWIEPVLEAVEIASKKIHVELTYLIIPGFNDTKEEIGKFVEWASQFRVPVHFSRHFPRHELDAGVTPMPTLLEAKRIAEEKIDFVYLGNVDGFSDTVCPQCRNVVVRRNFGLHENKLVNGKCPHCQREIIKYW